MEKNDIRSLCVTKQTSEELTRGGLGRDGTLTVVSYVDSRMLSLTSLSWQLSHCTSLGASAHIVPDTAPRLFVPFYRFVVSVAGGGRGPAAVSQQCVCGMFSFAFKAARSGRVPPRSSVSVRRLSSRPESRVSLPLGGAHGGGYITVCSDVTSQARPPCHLATVSRLNGLPGCCVCDIKLLQRR